MRPARFGLQAAAVGAPALLQFIKAGKLRCIATGTAQRIAQLPEVPTVAEQGFPGFEMTQWYGLNVPASMSQSAIDKLAAAAAKAVKEPATQERLANDAAIPVGSTPAEYAPDLPNVDVTVLEPGNDIDILPGDEPSVRSLQSTVGLIWRALLLWILLLLMVSVAHWLG